jgi:putative cell wall-binding protein
VAAAAGTSGPMLLTTSDVLAEPTRRALQTLRPSKVVILGGTTAVSAQVQDTIAKTLAASGGGSVVRQAGADRFETAAAVARSAYSTASTVYISTGMNFPDALSGGPVAGRQGAPMLLVTSDSIPAATRKAILDLRPSRVVVLGGTSAVSDAVAALL